MILCDHENYYQKYNVQLAQDTNASGHPQNTEKRHT